MGPVMAVQHHILVLGVLCVWVHSLTIASSSSCSNQTPCNKKGGTCISGSLHCSGKAYKAVRYCTGAGCKCCIGSYGPHSSPHSSGHHNGHGSCDVGLSCGRRGRCERGSCSYGYKRHAGDCGGGDCQCCAHSGGDWPDVDTGSHHGRRCSGSCGISGTCRNNCWSDEKLHSGHCGDHCQCCARKYSRRNQWKDVIWRDVSHGHCGGSCGWGKICRAYHCLTDEYEYGSCSAGYHCKCCKKHQKQMCYHPGINCNHGRGTCHERRCPFGQVSMGVCSGHSCVCCAHHNIGCLRPGAMCGVNGYCREGSCFINEYQIGSCGGRSCVCCVKNQLPACHALGASCLGTGFCRVGACNNNEIQSGTCSGTNCVCCTPYVQQVCINVNGPCNGHTGKCRSMCLPGEIDVGLGSCSGSACRCCKSSVCPAAICIKGSQRGECRPNGCQNTEFDVGECITGQTNCRCCCTHQVMTCLRVGAVCGRRGTCRTSGCLLGETLHSGDCGGGYCVCCATLPINSVISCMNPGSLCGSKGYCRQECLSNELQIGLCGDPAKGCVCCEPRETQSQVGEPVIISSGVEAVCVNPGSLCGSKGHCRQGCLSNELQIGLCGVPAKGCLCCEPRETQSQACMNPGSLCGSKGYCRQECFSNEHQIGLCGLPAKGCFCCEARSTQSQVKRHVNYEEHANVAEAVDNTVQKYPATLGTTDEGGDEIGSATLDTIDEGSDGKDSATINAADEGDNEVGSATLDTIDEGSDGKDSATIDATDEGTCPYDYIYVASQCLLFNVKETVNWNTAEKICGLLGGILVNVLDPQALSTFIKANYGKKDFWLGARDSSHEGTWRWTNGYILDKNFPWTPINNSNNQDCLEWAAKMQGYHGNDCDKTQNFICEATTGRNIEYKISIGQVTYVDECKKIDFMNVIQLICTRRKLPLRSGKDLALEDEHLHSSEEYKEYMEHTDQSIERSHNSDEEIEYYDSEEENMIKEEFLDDLDDLDYQHNGPFNLENALIHERENATFVKEDNVTIVSTSDNDNQSIAQEPNAAQGQSYILGNNTTMPTDNTLNKNRESIHIQNEEKLINDRTGNHEHVHGQSPNSSVYAY